MDRISLSTARLALVPPTSADIDAIERLCQDPTMQDWTTVPVPYTRNDAVAFVETIAAGGWDSGKRLTWAIRVDGDFAGAVSLADVVDGGAEIGFWLGAEHRGRGVMVEAVGAVLNYAFDAPPLGLGLLRVHWAAYQGNTASARVAQAAGFRYEGASRLGLAVRGDRVDSWFAGVLRGDDRTPVPWPELTTERAPRVPVTG